MSHRWHGRARRGLKRGAGAPLRTRRDEADTRGHPAVRERYPQLRCDPHRGRDPRNNMHRNPPLVQVLKLLSAAPEDERVAALEADDAGARAGELLRGNRRAVGG